MKTRIFVAQYADLHNNNPQVLNTRALLSRFRDNRFEWIVPHFGEPDPDVAANPNVMLVKLWPWRFWQWHKFLLYQYPVDAIFYPGPYWFDAWALRLRRLTGRRVPVIATLEGLVGNEQRAKEYSEWAGHPVYCQQIDNRLLARVDRILHEADHVIAISPFLARMGARRYGDKFSVLPLGIDSENFHARHRAESNRFTVVGAGRLYDNKRPQLFLDMAERWPQADFVWYGEGELHSWLRAEKDRRGLKNIDFPGPVSNTRLAGEFRKANLFVLPSLSEGVPKVTQESAACGLPVIIFGFYEAPTVVNGENGYVVWNDEELFARAEELIGQPGRTREMGARGVEMAKEWDWDNLGLPWESKLLSLIGCRLG